jgi:hypothetical protein
MGTAGWAAPGAPPPVVAPPDQVAMSIATHFTAGRLAPLLSLMAGGILIAAGAVLPWLSAAGGGSASAFDIDTFYGGPHAWLIVILGITVVAVAVARLAAAALPPALELIAAAAGLGTVVLAVIRYFDLQGILGSTASLGIGYYAEWIGAVIAIVAGVYPTYKAAGIRTRH